MINAFVDMFDTATIASIVAGASGLMVATMGAANTAPSTPARDAPISTATMMMSGWRSRAP